jgi:lipoprotein NlpI
MLPVGAFVRQLLLALFLAVVCGAAQAAGYDDFAHGLSANAQGLNDSAIASFSAAIAAGDLNPALLPMAYRGRAVAYLRKQQCASALPDLDKALQLNPGYADFLWLHADAAACLNKFDAALADYAALVAAKPDTNVYWQRGRLRWRMADFAAAAADFSHVTQLNPKFAYGVLWLELSRARAGALDSAVAAADMDRLNVSDWPQPLLALYAGTSKPEEVAAAAAHGDTAVVPHQQCEADFYLAEWWLARQDAATAKPLLQRAADQCPHDFVEFTAAGIELARLR